MIQKMQKTGPIHFQLGPQNILMDQMVKCELQTNIPDPPPPVLGTEVRALTRPIKCSTMDLYFSFSALFIF